jgi:iron complex outermembrane recepter protein
MKKFLSVFLLFIFFAINTAVCQHGNDTIKLKPVEVTDSTVKKMPFLVLEIKKSQLQAGSVNDIGNYLRTIPNVSGIRKGGASIDPVIRGFKFGQIGVILDNGIKIENGCPNRMDPVTARVEAEDIEKIEVVKGPFALRYGSSFGGLINLLTEQPHPYDTFQIHAHAQYGFETNWNGQKEHFSINGGNKKIYFLVSGGYKNYGSYESGNLEGHDTTFNSSFRKFNYNLKIGYSLSKKHSLIASYGKVCARDVRYPALPMDEKADDTQIMSLDYKGINLGDKFKAINSKIYCSIVDHLMDNSMRPGYDTKQMVSSVDAVNMGGRAEAIFQFNAHKLITGLNYENIMKDGTRTMTMQMMGTTSTKLSNLWYNAVIQNTGLLANYSHSFSSYEVTASIRFDYNVANSDDTLKIVKNDVEYFNKTGSQYLNFSASAGITKNINDHLSLSVVIGRVVRSPNMLERFIKVLTVGYDNYDYLGNPQLKPETNNEGDLTLKYFKDNIGDIYLNGFYSYVRDYITSVRLPPSVVTPQTQGVLGVKQFVNTDHVTFYGFEFGYTSPEKFRLGGTVVAAYTYAVIPEDTKYITSGTQVIGETTITNDALPEIPPFETTIGVSYKFMQGNIVPKISVRAVADQRHTSLAFYEPYTPGFALLNFSVKYKVNKYAEINVGINNIFDRAYYEHLNRKIIGTTGKLYEPGRVFFINLFLNI